MLNPSCKSTLVLCLLTVAANGDEVSFNRDIRPILSEHCLQCHGFDADKRQAELRLDTHAGAVAKLPGGKSAIVPGKPTQSELIARITSADAETRMPPVDTGKKLTQKEIQKLVTWIKGGASYERHWSFNPPNAAPIPEVSSKVWPRNSIDYFILARLDAESLGPSEDASPNVLLRRLSLDLIGLPPTLAELAGFERAWKDDPQVAWASTIKRLQASKHFGEKWARWWMDLAHYADTDGYTIDYDRPHAWRWRDWVIDAFNRNLPFDQFTLEQIAGDMLPDAKTEQRIATGFFRHTLSNREGGANLEEFRVQKIIDRTATYGATWLGLTVECAQCHDHKFDPISHREYYQLYDFFNNADEININAPLPGEQSRFDAALVEYRRRWHELVDPVEPQLNAVMRKWEQLMLDAEKSPGIDYKRDRALELLGILWGAGYGEGQLEGVRLTRIPFSKRTQRQKERLLDYFLGRGALGLEQEFKDLKLYELRNKIAELKKTLPSLSRPQTLEVSMFPRQTRISIRGDFRTPGAPVQSGFPVALHAVKLANPVPSRLDLARWTVSKDNPLTARVFVNRIWQELFGRGLVTTPEDFGAQGALPSHPKLLDWLAVDFVENGWDIKRLMRLMVDSATYRQSSHVTHEKLRRDPDNVLLARASRVRLSGELVRDAALVVSGLLDRRRGGPSVRPPQPANVAEEGSYSAKWETSTGGDRYRRGVYTWIQRVTPYAQFATFDLPNPNRTCSRRDRTNTPLQALTLLNDPVFVEASETLADRLLNENKDADDEQKIRIGYRVCFARDPQSSEVARLKTFIAGRRKAAANRKPVSEARPREWFVWREVAVVLMNLDEFITRE
ncbi:MAG: hypothetical protein CMJ78_21115 [Planctomycetaceae bacterium]|nr:hypothetical protein [Planctomycetaceae bacterium]